MKKIGKTSGLGALFVAISFGMFELTIVQNRSSVDASEVRLVDSTPQPVDDDMHHFMEYVFEPNYKRLKAALADEPENDAAWKAIKGDSLTLAECANLLLFRAPDENADQWRRISESVRSHGSELYQAARKTNYPAARQAYVRMLNNCNRCHTQFADGEHQLQP